MAGKDKGGTKKTELIHWVVDSEIDDTNYSAAVAFPWVKAQEKTFAFPPQNLSGKKKTWTDPSEPDETWDVYTFTHISGPYSKCFTLLPTILKRVEDVLTKPPYD
ncbi:hypothetical protein QAD02_014070 [Eretmocerus hayati]|uniref:Uncharacterized protein n=1 Tax=Eretmocerus hayati TaxID=131215 RepID=A0ACC2P599_9HYME|nr:hypothetical protein QAD02_014070 [Eretmocerus hayati]